MNCDYTAQIKTEHAKRPVSVLPAAASERPELGLAGEFILATVATVVEVDLALLLRRTRQMAMYLANAGCELLLTAVGWIFGRDRSTIAHACHKIDDAREVPAVGMMECSIRAIVITPAALRRELELAEWRGMS